MFSKLALRNVRRSFRDYGVYLLTLTFGVCLFYTFNSIDGQGAMVYLAQSQNPMAQLIQTILDIFSVFVAVVLACLILYANTFLIRRRKRELGTYLLLGLSQRQVSGLLVLETLVIGLISLAAGLLWGTGFGAFKAIGGPKPLDSLDVSELKGQYVEAEVYLIYDWYAYTERTNTSTNRSTVTEKEYIIPVGDAEYMGLAVDAGYISTADDLLDASYELLTGASQTPGESFTVRGTILPLSGESLDFYHQVVGYDDWTAEEQQMFLPLVLKADYLGSMDQSGTWLLTAGAGVALFAAVWMLAGALTGRYQKRIRAYCKASESPEAMLEQLETFYQSTEPVNGVRTGRWMMFETGGKTTVLDAENVAWAYMRTVQHRTNGIPTGKTHGLVVRTRDKKMYEISMKKQDMVYETLDAVQRAMPHVVVGYTARLEQIYNTRLEDFVRLPYDEALRAELFGTQAAAEPYDS